MQRFVNGVPDANFGLQGIAIVPLAGDPAISDVVPLADDSLLAVGATTIDGRRQAVVARLDERGALVPSFGAAGVAVVAMAHAGEAGVEEPAAEAAADGRIVLAATVRTGVEARSDFYRIGIARLMPDGTPDTRFAGAGIGSLWTAGGARLDRLALRASGEILVGTTAFAGVGASLTFAQISQLRGGDLPTAHPFRERRAIEYFDERSGPLFLVTASEVEIALLDTTPPPTWTRTGHAFNVFDEATAPLSPVCRFWSDQSFAPRSSHFYTPYAHECEVLKHGSTWRYEGDAFSLRLPEGTPGAKACPLDTQPLYRAYNNALSGAPNHRYMTDPALLDQMIAQGWTMEGEAGTRVFACVPLQESGVVRFSGVSASRIEQR